jgi:hypothetical protein
VSLVRMSIRQPRDGDVVVGRDDVGRTSVAFLATVDEVDPAAGPLHVRWYSTLPEPTGRRPLLRASAVGGLAGDHPGRQGRRR